MPSSPFNRARVPQFRDGMTRDGARAVLPKAEAWRRPTRGVRISIRRKAWACSTRPALRRWVAVNMAMGEGPARKGIVGEHPPGRLGQPSRCRCPFGQLPRMQSWLPSLTAKCTSQSRLQ
jgi:hypothetical protein